MNVHEFLAQWKAVRKEEKKNTYPPHHICEKRLSHFPFPKIRWVVWIWTMKVDSKIEIMVSFLIQDFPYPNKHLDWLSCWSPQIMNVQYRSGRSFMSCSYSENIFNLCHIVGNGRGWKAKKEAEVAERSVTLLLKLCLGVYRESESPKYLLPLRRVAEIKENIGRTGSLKLR